MSIALSAGVRQSLSAVQSATSQLSTIQNRLSTGKKVNTALDNPGNFFTASGLNNRANDLSRLLDDMGQSIKTLQAADKGLSSITNLVENAQSIAKQARAFKIEASVVTGNAATAVSADTVVDDATNATPPGLAFAVGETLTVTAGTGASQTVITYTTVANDTVQDILDDINADADISARIVDGQLEITDKKGRAITVAGTATEANLMGTSLTAAASEDKRVTLQADYDDLMSQIDQLARDSGYNGVNLLDGDDLSVQFNEKGSSKLNIDGADISATGLGIDTAQLDTAANIETALTSLKSALDELRTQSSTFGSNLSVVQNRQDFTNAMIGILQQGADALVMADANEEGANLLALQTRTQLAQTTLSMAAQSDQSVLRLF
jgi:flagellin-like hook-associated protein FlgL